MSNELTAACNTFKKALDAVQARQAESAVISHKGKTLLTVNRTRQNTVKLTIGGR